MIEPNMATMLAFVFSDVVPDMTGQGGDDAGDGQAPSLQPVFASVVNRTFNSLSIDSDTSTSDSAVLLANGASGAVNSADFETALLDVCLDLTHQLAADGEGATTVIEVTVEGAADDEQARTVAKSIVNSPLVKTAVFGNDPNWGRIAMAVGKVDDERIHEGSVTIRFGDAEVFPRQCSEAELADLSDYLAGSEVQIGVDLGIGTASWTVYGSDLSYEYVRINAEYTT
jgi:glutamate N-acetyltransferase/amino-acid N-acetyltransferase